MPMLSRLGQILRSAALVAISVIFASSADALCFYDGKHFTKAKDGDDFDRRLYAKTTLADEFADSVLWIRGTAVSSRNVPPGADPEGTIYDIQVDQTFKG